MCFPINAQLALLPRRNSTVLGVALKAAWFTYSHELIKRATAAGCLSNDGRRSLGIVLSSRFSTSGETRDPASATAAIFQNLYPCRRIILWQAENSNVN